MTQYKIHIDKPLPDGKRIKSHQDFDSLYDQYQVNARFEFWRQLYRNPRYFAGLAAVIAVLFLVYQAVDEERIMNLPYVNPLSSELAYQSQTFSVGAPISISGELARQINIPANAFVDAQGKPVEGEVEIKVLPLVDVQDLALRGLSMQIDSARQLVPKAGVEILAFRLGERVYLKPEASIEVEMLIPGQDENLALYQLDTAAASWAERPGLTRVAMEEAELPKPEKPILLAQLEAEDLKGVRKFSAAPFKPGKPFGVKLKNAADYPRLAKYDKTYWEYLEGPGSDNPWTTGLITASGQQQWEDVRVERLPGSAERYRLRFARQSVDRKLEVRVVVARPLFKARNQDEANAYYQQQLAQYET
ncbi:MAG: hypothetical protein AAFQ68_20525, partial [Bacteroidota bacterium]